VIERTAIVSPERLLSLTVMTRLGVLKNLRQLSMQTESEAAEGVEEILKALASLNYTELWDVLVDRNGISDQIAVTDSRIAVAS